MIIPPQKRTIFVETYTEALMLVDNNGTYYDLKENIELYKKNIIQQKKYNSELKKYNSEIFKFNLNIPKMKLQWYKNYIQFFPLNEENEPCISPLLNTDVNGDVCIEAYLAQPLPNILNNIYNSYFNFDRIISAKYYVPHDIMDNIRATFKRNPNYSYNVHVSTIHEIIKLYQKWEKDGYIQLIPQYK